MGNKYILSFKIAMEDMDRMEVIDSEGNLKS
jgi:hypothetical protein